MKYLVVFDTLTQAAQNWQAAVKAAREASLKPGNNGKVEVRICILKLLREDTALDTSLDELEYATLKKLKLARQAFTKEKILLTSLEVIQGIEQEAADLVGQRAAHWGADHIFVSLGKACWDCSTRARRMPILTTLSQHLLRKCSTVKEARSTERLPLEINEERPTLDSSILLQNATCRVSVTCHGAVLVSLQLHRASPLFSDTHSTLSG